MNFTIRKNSTLPTLKYDITYLVAADATLAEKLKSGVVTFSMVDKATSQFIIANKTGKLAVEKPATHIVGTLNGLKYYLTYKWTRRDTSKLGEFRGEFRLDFIDGTSDSMVFPESPEAINISIVSTLTTTTNTTVVPEEEVITPAPTTGSTIPETGVLEHTYAELKALKSIGKLLIGREYLLTDFQSIHILESRMCTNCPDAVLGAIEPLILSASDNDKFAPIAKSKKIESDIIHYSFDLVSEACDLVTQSKGVITYREDVVNKLSAHYDWRIDPLILSSVGDINTFGVGCKNITIGAGSKFITIGSGSSDITIGKSCRKIKLPQGSNAINIGNKVKGYDFSAFLNNPSVNRNLTIYDNGTGGQLYMEIDLLGRGIYKVGQYDIGLLPKRMMPTNYSLSVTQVSGTGSRLSLAIKSVLNDDILPETFVSELNNTYIYNTLFMNVSEKEEAIVLNIKGVDLVIPEDGSFIRFNLNFIKV
jgi:hypothetical protein